MSIEVRVPALGESVTEATVASWAKTPGEAVIADEMLAELETDKVTVEVRAPAAGTLSEIVTEEGASVGVDALLATIAEGAGAGATQAAAETKTDAAPTPARGPDSGDDGPGAPPGDGGGGARVDVMVPALGESVTEATVGSWAKAPGASVGADEVLVELETDKVAVEVSAPAAGTLSEILAGEGETVAPGGRLAVIATGAGGAAQPTDSGQTAAADSAPGKAADASPSAQRMMEEHGLSPAAITGSGKDGRILKEDVQSALDSPGEAPPARAPEANAPEAKAPAPEPTTAPGPAPAPEPAQPPRGPVPAEDEGREERVRMSRLRQTVARRLKDAQNTAAMLTTYNEVDMSAIMALRADHKDLFEKKHGVKLGFMSFFVKACCHALFEVPEVNAEIDGQEVVYKHYVHMGVAVGSPQGLVVPVLRDAHRKSFAAIETEINALGAKARDGKLSMADLQGGTFTISNGGVYGSLMSSPILNPPQSGILGMHKIQERPMVVGGEITARPMMYLALSYDHRIVDGKGAVTFLVRVKEALEDPRRLLMDL